MNGGTSSDWEVAVGDEEAVVDDLYMCTAFSSGCAAYPEVFGFWVDIDLIACLAHISSSYLVVFNISTYHFAVQRGS